MAGKCVDPELADRMDERFLTPKQKKAKKEGREAVRAIGPDAYPFLADWIGATAPAWRSWLYDHTSWNAKRRILFRLLGDPNEVLTRQKRAAEGILIFSNNAAPILPQLIKCFEQRTNEHDLVRLCTAIAEVRDGSLEYLLKAARPPYDASHRYFAVWGVSVLHEFGTNVSAVAPILIDMLEGQDLYLATRAASAIGVFQSAPERAIPALTNAIATREAEVAVNSIYALQHFDAQQTKVALPMLYPALAHTNEAIRKAATQTVTHIEQSLSTNNSSINN
jgi:hypothetical protein